MKKFSRISNYEVPNPPKEEKVDEAASKRMELRTRVLKLMDDLLSVRSYGSARPEIMIPTHIAGKEMLAEALVDLMESGGRDETVKVLEGLKTTVKDWRSIDDKIAEISQSRNLVMERKINGIVERWGDDEALLSERVRTHGSNLTSDGIQEAIRCVNALIANDPDGMNRKKLEVVRSAYQSS
jgi:hypothetical protein